MIITIDGPSGTGKSTVAKRLAERLQFSYFDTGAMYRAIAWLVLDRHVCLSDINAVESVLSHFNFIIEESGDKKRYLIGNQDVSEEIRTKRITDIVSEVSALKSVRDLLLVKQRQYALGKDAVFEGRDLGTVVFPEADVKVFLTARPEIRAKRRHQEIVQKNIEKNQSLSEMTVLQALQKRDEVDSNRELAPLRCPPDALVIDTSELSVEQVIEKILQCIQNK